MAVAAAAAISMYVERLGVRVVGGELESNRHMAGGAQSLLDEVPVPAHSAGAWNQKVCPPYP